MVSKSEIIEKLLMADIFSSVSAVNMDGVFNEENLSIQLFKSGELIYSSSKHQSAIGFIFKGDAQVIKNGSILVGRLFEGDIFGAQSLFLSPSYFTNEIIANHAATVVFISKSAITALMQLQPQFSLSYIRYLSERIYFLNGRIVNFTGGTAESRLANYLLTKLGDYKTLVLDIPINQLAVSLDIGRASLYRAFDSLESSGAIEKKGKSIRLLSKETLVSFIS